MRDPSRTTQLGHRWWLDIEHTVGEYASHRNVEGAPAKIEKPAPPSTRHCDRSRKASASAVGSIEEPPRKARRRPASLVAALASLK